MISAKEFNITLLAIDPRAVDFEPRVDALLTQVNLSEVGELLNSVFNFFEKHPHEDAGAPGSLVHFAEHYYPAYTARLLVSLFVAPSVGAILMTNRILNSELSPSERLKFLSALEAIAANPKASPVVQDRARHFLAHQSGKRA